MLRTISFNFESEHFKVQLDVFQKEEQEIAELDSASLFLKFLKDLNYIRYTNVTNYASEEIKISIFSNNEIFKSNEIKEKAQELGLTVLTST